MREYLAAVDIAIEAKSVFEKIGRAQESASLYERARNLSERSLWADQAEDAQAMAEVAGKSEAHLAAVAKALCRGPSRS